MSASFVPLPGIGVDVRTWHPTRDATGPATQVHLVIPIDAGPESPCLVVRLKTAAGVRHLVDALLDHAADVWPEDFRRFRRGGSR